MIHLVIDTTALRNDPARKKAAFHSLKRLAEIGEIKIHFSHIVIEEFLSQQTEQYVAGLSEIKTSIVKFRKKYMPDIVREVLDNTNQELSRLKEKLVTFLRTDFDQWIKAVNAEIHGISNSHGKKVIEAYFSGSSPFREKKRRDDIPDAFIWQIILDLIERFNEVYIVSGDGAIKTASKAHASIFCFSTIDELIASDTCQTPLKKNLSKSNFQHVVSIYPKFFEELKLSIASQTIDLLAGKTVTDQQIPDDNNNATIISVGEPEDFKIFADNIEYFGDGVFMIPVMFSVECLVSYAIFKSDFHILPDDKMDHISISELNDAYYDAEEYYSLNVTASVSINFKSAEVESKDISDERLTELAEDAETSLDSVGKIEISRNYPN